MPYTHNTRSLHRIFWVVTPKKIQGLRHARGAFIARLDADDVACPGRIARQLRALQGGWVTGVGGCVSVIAQLTRHNIPNTTHKHSRPLPLPRRGARPPLPVLPSHHHLHTPRPPAPAPPLAPPVAPPLLLPFTPPDRHAPCCRTKDGGIRPRGRPRRVSSMKVFDCRLCVYGRGLPLMDSNSLICVYTHLHIHIHTNK